MQKPSLFRAIYSELRNSLGPEAPGAELLRLAHLILRAYTADTGKIDENDWAYKGRSLVSLPVDEAMRDGGWRILEFENENLSTIDDRDNTVLVAIRPLIEKYLGPEWQHHFLTGQL
jgi:hypothetical protein